MRARPWPPSTTTTSLMRTWSRGSSASTTPPSWAGGTSRCWCCACLPRGARPRGTASTRSSTASPCLTWRQTGHTCRTTTRYSRPRTSSRSASRWGCTSVTSTYRSPRCSTRCSPAWPPCWTTRCSTPPRLRSWATGSSPSRCGRKAGARRCRRRPTTATTRTWGAWWATWLASSSRAPSPAACPQPASTRCWRSGRRSRAPAPRSSCRAAACSPPACRSCRSPRRTTTGTRTS
mmetsp:Transcript_34827/g.88259  ORF Transcript_34827/g.88259 Transcript_34827/m.88259 type:complete len:234 (-) Transcript_34827:1584-2285(-)